MLVDSHAHLDMEKFDPDRDEVICRAGEAGVGLILTIASAKPGGDSVEKTLDLLDRYECLVAGVGVHPHDAALIEDRDLDELEQWAKHPRVVLWGEIGLDYFYEYAPRETQRRAFSAQLELARRHGLPVAIHCRDAWPDLLGILRKRGREMPGGILHSFTGTRQEALECADLGYLISFSGIVTFKNADPIRAAAKELSLESILIETDSPYLAPPPHRGKRNEPAFVVDVARNLAGTLGVSLEELAEHTSRNFCRLTGVPLMPGDPVGVDSTR